MLRLELPVQAALGDRVGFPGWTGEPCLLRGTQVCVAPLGPFTLPRRQTAWP